MALNNKKIKTMQHYTTFVKDVIPEGLIGNRAVCGEIRTRLYRAKPNRGWHTFPSKADSPKLFPQQSADQT